MEWWGGVVGWCKVVGWGSVFDPYVWSLWAVFAYKPTPTLNRYSPPSATLSLFIYTLSSFSSLYLFFIYHFTPPLPLYYTLGFLGLLVSGSSSGLSHSPLLSLIFPLFLPHYSTSFYSSIILCITPFHLIYSPLLHSCSLLLFSLFLSTIHLPYLPLLHYSLSYSTLQHSALLLLSLLPLSFFILYFKLLHSSLLHFTLSPFYSLYSSTLQHSPLSPSLLLPFSFTSHFYSVFHILHYCTQLYYFITLLLYYFIPYSIFSITPLSFHLPYSLFFITTLTFIINFHINHFPHYNPLLPFPFPFPFPFQLQNTITQTTIIPTHINISHHSLNHFLNPFIYSISIQSPTCCYKNDYLNLFIFFFIDIMW